MQGLQQATAITSKFGLPSYLLPKLLSGSFMPVMKRMLQSGVGPLGTAKSHSRSTSRPVSSHIQSQDQSLAQKRVPHAVPGSPAWHAQLERIRSVCQEAGIEHDIIDGFLASSSGSGSVSRGAHLQELDSVHSGARVQSACLDSNRSPSPQPVVVQSPVVAAAFGKSQSGSDLLDFSGLTVPVQSACHLDVQLMNAVHMEEEVLSGGWVP
jgi:hypothetical protein